MFDIDICYAIIISVKKNNYTMREKMILSQFEKHLVLKYQELEASKISGTKSTKQIKAMEIDLYGSPKWSSETTIRNNKTKIAQLARMVSL